MEMKIDEPILKKQSSDDVGNHDSQVNQNTDAFSERGLIDSGNTGHQALPPSGQGQVAMQFKGMGDSTAPQSENKNPVQRKENRTGLPDKLKSGIENLSGYSMDDVKVHYNSSQPAQLQAHAFAQGTDIHLASGQEKHLPHEAWHVVQQKQGRVRPTVQMKGKVQVNDDAGLEREADVMGERALVGNVCRNRSGEAVNEGIKQVDKISGHVQETQKTKVLQAKKNPLAGKHVTLKMINEHIVEVNEKITIAYRNLGNRITREDLNDSLKVLETMLANYQTYTKVEDTKNMPSDGKINRLSGKRKDGSIVDYTGNIWDQIKKFLAATGGKELLEVKKNKSAKNIVNALKPQLESIARRYLVDNASEYGREFARARYSHLKKNKKVLRAVCSNFQDHAAQLIYKADRSIRVEKVGSRSVKHNWVVVGRVPGSDLKNVETWGDDCVTVDLWEAACFWRAAIDHERDEKNNRNKYTLHKVVRNDLSDQELEEYEYRSIVDKNNSIDAKMACLNKFHSLIVNTNIASEMDEDELDILGLSRDEIEKYDLSEWGIENCQDAIDKGVAILRKYRYAMNTKFDLEEYLAYARLEEKISETKEIHIERELNLMNLGIIFPSINGRFNGASDLDSVQLGNTKKKAQASWIKH